MYEPKNYEHLLGAPGFSEQSLKNHFTLYQGYVKNVNTLVQEREALIRDGRGGAPQYAELTRRFGWEFNGMRLHELYFGNMAQSGVALASDSLLGNELVRVFGSFENWEKDFRAAGGMRGIGWVVLYFDPEAKMFFNVWVNEHDMGHLATAVPLLVLDVFEHAYMLDYGIKKAEYLDAFFKVVNWSVVSDRFMQK
ncbi:MAG: superoxide dismutase [Candidatus Sungbacteria bacterium RIFCSPLOWO2_02_FULL_51_17]|uniref:superoxide dismutase n=1 Tax=Candidatus Sungbacteria bacterium RIFCSPHIGHO2_02_FULL_51_29 TaxID=1802273 RepID=A0A1G2KUZ8_9BACT|nr:MAG: superoxide dismutase [Candidatus Sungbacteria bacterium RIFCSPHIGHO2_01_FULL_51_22]OHA02281.1 MAG: superoxide dismutase [Candidatus Sungbacteria bacterium RIFCSPHIGHO2_02_FULL_51_29]OHA07156.1 MAG: superoxide dismutase [Candidatus Sungbacteria bacterium RIFCSPLOWO2_01_FULL_51_34]OHA11870.1 MAG: superoxide dismutase [Candidatus Sungbacteria bacterium RIFCSPLOWO2_02_FULL_51_17]